MFWFYTTVQAIVFDASNFCYQISQLTQLTSPERFDQMNYVGQREESLQQIVSIPREESLPQIVSGNYYHNAIIQNLSEQDTCFDSKELIDRERNAVDLYDQRDSKGKCLSVALKKDFLKTIYSWREMSWISCQQVSSKFSCDKQWSLENWGHNICPDTCATACANRNSATPAVCNLLSKRTCLQPICRGKGSNVHPTHLLWELSVDQETASYIWRCGGKVVSATVCPARTWIIPAT